MNPTQDTNDIPVYLGLKGSVLALDRDTGQELWRTPLKGADFVNVVFDIAGDLIATTRGQAFRLDPATGQILWTNPLKGLGFGLITVATAAAQQLPPAEIRRRQEAANNSTAATVTVVAAS